MDMKRCMNGHYYDASVNQVCPYCGQGQQGGQMQYGMGQPGMAPMGQPGMGQGVNMNMGMPADSGKTLPLGAVQSAGYGAPQQPIATGAAAVNAAYGAAPVGGDDDGKTVALIKKELGIDPVVGWLVCISGAEKGKDYRIHSDNNFIGRSDRMDICIKGDETISRDNHAIISYDTKEQKYFFSPGEGRTIIRHNGNAIFQTTELSANDRISIGNTELVFVPFCTEDFTWSEE